MNDSQRRIIAAEVRESQRRYAVGWETDKLSRDMVEALLISIRVQLGLKEGESINEKIAELKEKRSLKEALLISIRAQLGLKEGESITDEIAVLKEKAREHEDRSLKASLLEEFWDKVAGTVVDEIEGVKSVEEIRSDYQVINAISSLKLKADFYRGLYKTRYEKQKEDRRDLEKIRTTLGCSTTGEIFGRIEEIIEELKGTKRLSREKALPDQIRGGLMEPEHRPGFHCEICQSKPATWTYKWRTMAKDDVANWVCGDCYAKGVGTVMGSMRG